MISTVTESQSESPDLATALPPPLSVPPVHALFVNDLASSAVITWAQK